MSSHLGRGKVRKTTRRRVRREIRRMGTRVLILVEGKFLMEANRKTTKRRVRRDHEDGNQSSYLAW